MTGLDNILNEIKSESEAAAQKTVAEAESEADRIISEAQKEGRKLSDNIIKAAERKAEMIVARGESAAELEHKRVILKKKRELIEKYIFSAKQRLESLEGKEYFEVLKRIIEKNASGDEGTAVFSNADKKAMDSDFKAFLKKNNLKLSENELADGARGLIIDYGNIEENCTFDAIFDSMAEELSDKTMELLFE